jgi:hypothetical protein
LNQQVGQTSQTISTLTSVLEHLLLRLPWGAPIANTPSTPFTYATPPPPPLFDEISLPLHRGGWGHVEFLLENVLPSLDPNDPQKAATAIKFFTRLFSLIPLSPIGIWLNQPTVGKPKSAHVTARWGWDGMEGEEKFTGILLSEWEKSQEGKFDKPPEKLLTWCENLVEAILQLVNKFYYDFTFPGKFLTNFSVCCKRQG